MNPHGTCTCHAQQWPTPPSYPSIIVEDKNLSIIPFDINLPSDVPQYICISYVWGSCQVSNTIYPTVTMSDCTLPAVAAAIQNCDPDHSASMIWIDAFSVPTEPL